MAEDISTEWKHPSPSVLGRFLTILDSRLRDWNSVFEYTTHPHCLLRLGISRVEQRICLADGTSAQIGARMIDLHLWNEHIPPMPKTGVSLGWARRMNDCMLISLEELARFMQRRQDLDDIVLFRANTAFAGPEHNARSIRLMRRYGFEPVIERSPTLSERGSRLAQNLLITLMVLAYNRPAIRRDTLRRARAPVFLSRVSLERRYLRRSSEG